MKSTEPDKAIKFSLVIPCFNEEKTLKRCVEKVLEIADESLSL
ncbi:MAG: glycosyltransferase [Deltaproteobacteria bacterium]|nr:glycosyltransferase [Deltaproteobacteria bacterium]MBW1798098.1 glycosyltransferase [Deltaproteobacteria bacterium]MBW2117369.1 glycosyltransferase [Deltaproteobacteria bacterium]MBW2343293.1 glycosyltransferase [Deltaproteobacteria bacterium]